MTQTAVILVARKERTSPIPYPLVEFSNGENLIQRTLNILRKLSFKHITMVVGYRAELFSHYKQQGINIVVNTNFAHTASMASLALAAPYVNEDFLLIEGDTFYEEKVIEQLANVKSGNCFATTEESGSGDEAFIETQEGFITKLSKDKHQIARFEGELLGICKLTLSTFHKMVKEWKTATNPFLNYEYVFIDQTQVLERRTIHFTNLIWGDVDDEEDLQHLRSTIYPMLRRKENPFDKENIETHLKTIFNIGSKDSIDAKIEQIGGMSNKNFKVVYNKATYVLRIPGLASEEMVNRTYEEQNSILAANMGINPPIRYFNNKTGIKLADYILNAETLNAGTIQRYESIKQIALLYKKLHTSKVRFHNDFNVFTEIEKYEHTLNKLNGTPYDGYQQVKEQLPLLEKKLNQIGIQVAPCHNDAVAENFIKDNNGNIYLIDWEYSGMNDPAWEFAALFIESNFTNDNQQLFLDIYYNGNVPEGVLIKIKIYQILMDVLWALWTVIKETKGDDFGTYGIERFQRALKALKQL